MMKSIIPESFNIIVAYCSVNNIFLYLSGSSHYSDDVYLIYCQVTFNKHTPDTEPLSCGV